MRAITAAELAALAAGGVRTKEIALPEQHEAADDYVVVRPAMIRILPESSDVLAIAVPLLSGRNVPPEQRAALEVCSTLYGDELFVDDSSKEIAL